MFTDVIGCDLVREASVLRALYYRLHNGTYGYCRLEIMRVSLVVK